MKSNPKLKKDIKNFGMGLAVLILAFNGVHFWRTGVFHLIPLAVAGMVLGCSFLCPILLLPIYRFFSFIGKYVNRVITYLMMALVYFVVMTPISFVLRMLGKQLMTNGPDSESESYWESVEPSRNDPETMRKQF